MRVRCPCDARVMMPLCCPCDQRLNGFLLFEVYGVSWAWAMLLLAWCSSRPQGTLAGRAMGVSGAAAFCSRILSGALTHSLTHTHTHTLSLSLSLSLYIYINIYIYIYMYIYIYIWQFVLFLVPNS